MREGQEERGERDREGERERMRGRDGRMEREGDIEGNAPDTPSRVCSPVFVVCPAPAALVTPLLAAFRPIERVE